MYLSFGILQIRLLIHEGQTLPGPYRGIPWAWNQAQKNVANLTKNLHKQNLLQSKQKMLQKEQKNVCEQNLFQIEQKMLQGEKKCSLMKIASN